MHDAFKKERSRNTQTHDLLTELFWLQVKEDSARELRWVLRKSFDYCFPQPSLGAVVLAHRDAKPEP